MPSTMPVEGKFEELKSRWATLKAARAVWESDWQELAEYCAPQKANLFAGRMGGGDSRGVRENSRLHDSTAIQANLTLAQGQLALVTPMEERWIAFDAARGLEKSDAVQGWLARCAEVMSAELFKSNFYTTIHEFYLDRSAFGTSCIYLEEQWSGDACVNFRAIPIGTYCIAENEKGYVDTVYVSRRMTARQLVQSFGVDVLPKRVQVAYADAKKQNETFEVVHGVYPRSDQELFKNREKSDGWMAVNKPFASVWFMPDDGVILRESGYDAQPYLVSRYLKWGDEPWGWSAGFSALPDMRQGNFLHRMMDALAEVAAFPRLLIPSDMIRNVALEAGGVTVWNPSKPNATPKEWASGGRFDVGMERIADKEKKINRAFHVDLFQMFAQIDREMTAVEVRERASEKVVQFSPTFARLSNETLAPLVLRLFRIMNARGMFPPTPPEMVKEDRGGAYIPLPTVKFVSKIAMALRALGNNSFMQLLGAIEPMVAIDPSAGQILAVERAARGLARNFGVPEDWLRTEDELAQMQAAQAQAQMAQQQAETAQAMAGAAKDASQADAGKIQQLLGGGA